MLTDEEGTKESEAQDQWLLHLSKKKVIQI